MHGLGCGESAQNFSESNDVAAKVVCFQLDEVGCRRSRSEEMMWSPARWPERCSLMAWPSLASEAAFLPSVTCRTRPEQGFVVVCLSVHFGACVQQ